MREYCPDNLSVWQAHECSLAKQEAWEEAHLPVCDICGETIEDEDFLEVEGYAYHRDCFYEEHMMSRDRWLDRFR